MSTIERLFARPTRPLSVLALYIAALTTLYATMSGPARELVPVAGLLRGLSAVSREGRVVLVYHTLAVPFVAFLATAYAATLPLADGRRRAIVHALFFGSLAASIGGALYAYGAGGMIAHGVFVAGLSVSFYAGLNLTLAVAARSALGERALGALERVATGLAFGATLVSSAIGGAVGAFFGTGLGKAFLAEDIVRARHDVFMRAVIAHLHIMLTLVAVAIVLLLARYYRYREPGARPFHALLVAGTIVTAASTWSVIVASLEKQAHRVINVGALFLLAAAALLAVRGLRNALGRRPLNAYAVVNFAYLLLVNAFVTAPGVYVAVNLERFRGPRYASVERSFAVGHWHVLAVMCALMALMLFLDMAGARGRAARALAWVAGASSVPAFGAALAYMFRQPGGSGGGALAWLEPFVAVLLASSVALVGIGAAAGWRGGPAWGDAFSSDISVSDEGPSAARAGGAR